MRKFSVFIVLPLLAFLASCGEKKENKISEETIEQSYCNCVLNTIDSNYISFAGVDSLKKVCLNKYKSINFQSENVLKLDTSANEKLLNNIDHLLIQNDWSASDSWNEEWRSLSFDGKMFIWKIMSFGKYTRDINENSVSGNYLIEVNKNGSTYVTIEGGGEKAIFKLLKNKDSYYLEGNHKYIAELKKKNKK